MPEHDIETDRDGVPPSITAQIKAFQDRTGDSLYEIEARSMRLAPGGHGVSQKYLWRVSVGDVKGFPRNVETFVAIAVGIETTPLAVLLGYAVSLGVPVEMPRLASMLPATLNEAPQRQQDALLIMARAIAFADQAPERHEPADATPDVTGAAGMLEEDGSAASSVTGESPK